MAAWSVAEVEQQPLHSVFGKVLRVAQFFALLPVSHVCAGDVAALRYTWRSWRCLYALLVIVLNFLEFLTAIHLVCLQGLSFHTSGAFALYVVCLLEHCYFWLLAARWPALMRQWRRVELRFQRPPYGANAGDSRRRLKARIYGFTLVVMLCALLEHVLLVFNSFHKSELERTQCHLNISYWESLYRRERYHLSLVVPFHVWLLPLLEWINLTLAYVRSFTDAFIVCISIALASHYQRLGARIAAVHTRLALPAVFWTEVRQDYLLLQRLLRQLNRALAPLVVLACTNNMYFICSQLFSSLQNIGVDAVAMLGFWYSLLFAIVRTLFTLYMASTLHDSSGRILQLLRDVPSVAWSMELQRFSEQLSTDLTALSGDGFFYLTRQLMLAMASTIVTYEVLATDVINHGSARERTNYCT